MLGHCHSTCCPCWVKKGLPPWRSLRLATACWLRGCAAWTALLSGPWHLSPPTRDRTPVPGVARLILNHWPGREVPDGCLKRCMQYFQMCQQYPVPWWACWFQGCMCWSNLAEMNAWKWSILLCVNQSSVSLTLKTLHVRRRCREQNMDTGGEVEGERIERAALKYVC